MADQLDNRPVFTIVMGCNGSGKSAWKRANQDRLPERYFDKDSVADGIGGWDTASARERTDAYVNAEIDQALAERRDFGIESTYSGRPGRALVERAQEAGYRIEGTYIGTAGPAINVERIARRVERRTGHWVDPLRVPERYRYSLHNLRQTGETFDELTLVDNSADNARGIPDPRTELVLERGRISYQAEGPAAWVAQWRQRFEHSLRDRTSARRGRSSGSKGDAQGAQSGTPASDPAGAPAKGAGAPG